MSALTGTMNLWNGSIPWSMSTFVFFFKMMSSSSNLFLWVSLGSDPGEFCVTWKTHWLIDRLGLLPQRNCGYEQCHKVGQWLILPAWGFFIVCRNFNTYHLQLKVFRRGQRIQPQHCWRPRPGIKPATLSSAGQQTHYQPIYWGQFGKFN